MHPTFVDRTEAGRRLADRLAERPLVDPIVLAVPPGGVPVGREVARQLGAPLDFALMRELRLPGRDDLALGALAAGGVRVLNWSVIRGFRVTSEELEAATARARHELRGHERAVRRGRPALDVAGRTVILVDDGLASSGTMKTIAASLRPAAPRAIVVATPIATWRACHAMSSVVDDVVWIEQPRDVGVVSRWYESPSEEAALAG